MARVSIHTGMTSTRTSDWEGPYRSVATVKITISWLVLWQTWNWYEDDGAFGSTPQVPW